ncbi:MAG: VOC family protein [Thermoplasmata archaeon]
MQPTRTPKLAPYLVVKDASGLAQFLEKALGGRLSFEEKDPSGRVVHSEVQIADGLVMIGDVPEGHPTVPAMIHLYVTDADAAYQRALKAGASSVRAPEDAPDGDRRGGVKDAWGNQWWFTRARSGE